MAGSRQVYAPEFKLQAVQMVTDQKLYWVTCHRRGSFRRRRPSASRCAQHTRTGSYGQGGDK